jgi:hypothetical protein
MFYRPNLRNIFFVNEVSIVIGLVTEYVSATSFSSCFELQLVKLIRAISPDKMVILFMIIYELST